MGEHYRSMNYLTVNAEDYLRPRRHHHHHNHHRLSRSITPHLGASAAFDSRSDSIPTLHVSSSDKSLLNLDKDCLSDCMSADSLVLPKSSDSLFFGKAQKILHRRAHVTEIYRSRCNTDPGLTHGDRQLGVVPILTIPGAASLTPTPLARRKHMTRRASALSSLIEQTLMVTTATVGLKTASDERLAQQTSKSLNEDVKRGFSRSANSVSANANTDASMAPLQSHAEAHSLNTLEQSNSSSPRSKQLQHQRFNKQLSTSGSTQSGYSSANSSVNESNQSLSSQATGNNRSETRPLKHSSSSLNPFGSVASSRSLSPSRRSVSSNSSNTAKHEHSTAAAAAASAVTTTPPEKEKKRKEVSSSRVKKFHRHFNQVPKDEKLINYFSCALVSDILLQGHLYITEQHFAFYSNVFGYITKVVIPTSSVTKISKEKTAKIIPNAVGVATADERHVFGSFISREAAFRLMCSVCPPLAPVEIIAKMPTDIEISEEYSIEDDSSCSISGNESPPQLAGAVAQAQAQPDDNNSQALLRRTAVSSSLNLSTELRRDIPANAKSSSASAQHANVGVRASAPPATHYESAQLSLNAKSVAATFINTPTTGAAASAAGTLTMIIAGTASSTATSASSSSSTPSSSSSPPTTVAAKPKSATQAAADNLRTFAKQTLLRLKFPTELHIVYVGVLLSIVLALFSVFLLYRILAIEAKTGYSRSPAEFNWRSGNDEDIFAEALRWQKELQTKSSDEAQSILNTNLEQIAKVRRSLETLSMLIHDRSSAYTNRDDSD